MVRTSSAATDLTALSGSDANNISAVGGGGTALRRRGCEVWGQLLMRASATVALIVLVFLGAGCAPIPDLIFSDPEAVPNDATLAESDGSFEGPEPDATDASSPDTSLEGASSVDAADSSPSDAGLTDAADALACLPAKAPPEAGCCYAVLPCVGLGCEHCSACIAQACHTNQFLLRAAQPSGDVSRRPVLPRRQELPLIAGDRRDPSTEGWLDVCRIRWFRAAAVDMPCGGELTLE